MNIVEWHTALALGKLGYKVDLMTRRSSPDQPERQHLAQGVDLLHLHAGPAQPLPKSAIDRYIPEFTASMTQAGNYDLYHAQHWMSGVAALDLARGHGVPIVVSFHSVAAHPDKDLREGEPPESEARVPGEALLAQACDQVIAISAAEARTVIERCGANPENVTIIPPGVDLDLFHPMPRPAQSRPFLAFAARLQPLKGPDLAIEALSHIDPTLRPRLVIAGAQSLDFAFYAAHLSSQVETLELTNDVSFIGPASRTQLAALFAEASLVLVPSYSETFGLVALEAAACGTPVIASAAGGLREAVVHGETGQLMDSRRPADWARAMIELLEDPATLRRMGVVARVHARRFTWDLTARRISDVYDRLLA